MKKFVYILLILPAMFFMSCDDFLDVSSDREMLQDETLSKREGVHMYVNGIYRLLSEPILYGRELTWGLNSVLGFNYTAQYSYQLRNEYWNASQYNWEYSGLQSLTSSIWEKAYEVIANCNNLLQEVEEKDVSFFAEGEMEKQMILGEMYGLRALMHFDLLRLFAPAPVTKSSGLFMPYVTKYPEYQPVHKSVDDVLNLVIKDMEYARTLLAEVDTVFCLVQNRTINARIFNPNAGLANPPADFFMYRAERMNYMAATGLLARIYLYKGDMEKAYKYAKEVTDRFVEELGWYSWTSSGQQNNTTASNIYPKRYNELILSFHNDNSYDNWEDYTTNSNSSHLKMNTNYLKDLFLGDEDDYRYKGFFGTSGRYNNNQRWLVWERPQSTGTVQANVTCQGPLLPILRFSELYYIQIECLLKDQNNANDAREILNSIRSKRGAKTEIGDGTTEEELLNILYKEIIRETLTEGQTFYLFKRLDMDVYNGTTPIKMSPEKWYAPLPNGETSYL